MRILILNFNLKGIGTYQRSFYFSRELARHGHDVTMVTVSRRYKYRHKVYFKRDWIGEYEQPIGEGPWVRMIEAPNLGYKWFPGHGGGPLDIGLRIAEIHKGNFDVVYGFEHNPNVAWPVYVTRPFKRYRFYSDWCDLHGGVGYRFRGCKLIDKMDGFFEERIRMVAHKVTTNSSLIRQRAIQIGVSPERVIFIPQGSDPDYVKPVDSKLVRQRYGLPLNAPLLGMRSDTYWRETLEIFKEILKHVPDTCLLIVGQRQVGLREYADQLGIARNIIETGWVSDEDYPLYLASADVLLFIMKNDLFDLGRWPGTIGDFLATGRPIVVTNVGDAAAFIKKHNAGLVVNDLEEMTTQIVCLLGNDEARRFYGEQARKAAVIHLDWKVLGGLINQVVED
ncbi:MAG: hypothetical protein KatS3mg055_0865 [Chloroflexus sp.]|uniref:glycosyltransferase n=1 Tax=Chloroflexus sp. TaxID=1904827 RepID=UPI0021DE361B|nr:glycosyltransferase [Chloroflexus sp.]GIV88347.1 MAG: hypothetical protein KatS3mg055_0865 [Chloroflexus sp.]